MSQYSQFFYLYTKKYSHPRATQWSPGRDMQCDSVSAWAMVTWSTRTYWGWAVVSSLSDFPLLEPYLALLCAPDLWDDWQEGEDGMVETSKQSSPALSDDLVLPVGVTTDRGFKAHGKPGMTGSMERDWEASITVCFTCVYFAAFLNRPWSGFWNRSANVTVWVDHAL